MADGNRGDTEDAGFIGLLLVGMPAGWWIPPGYTLRAPDPPTISLRIVDPFGLQRTVYPTPSYALPGERSERIAAIIERELGPFPAPRRFTELRGQLGANQSSGIGLLNRALISPLEAAASLLDLATYGINASVVAGTERMRQAGWLNQTEAHQLRRDLHLLMLAAGSEIGFNPTLLGTRVEPARLQLMVTARVAARAGPGLTIRFVGGSETAYAVMEEFRVASWLERVMAGRRFDRAQEPRYRFNQLYVERPGQPGYTILDSYIPRDSALAHGPVSRKFTQIAEIHLQSAINALQEAKTKYSPGFVFADVPSTPALLVGKQITGQLILEIPVQTLRIPQDFVDAASARNILIRDVTGRVHN